MSKILPYRTVICDRCGKPLDVETILLAPGEKLCRCCHTKRSISSFWMNHFLLTRRGERDAAEGILEDSLL